MGNDNPPNWLGSGWRKKKLPSFNGHDIDFDSGTSYLVMPCLHAPVYDVDVFRFNDISTKCFVRERNNPSGIPCTGNILRHNNAIQEYAQNIASVMNLESLHDIDMMTDPTLGPVLLEINPRPSGSLAGLNSVGFHLLDYALACAAGIPIDIGEVQNDTRIHTYTECSIFMTGCVAIIQARLGSSRLPGKVLLPLGETTVLGLMVQRVKKAKQISEIIIAITENDADDVLHDEAGKLGVSVFRGDEQDVLSRVYRAVEKTNADVIVRLTADCPLMDGRLIDEALIEFMASDYDYYSNVIHRSFPDGLDIEIFSAETLATTALECVDQWSREHVTPYMRTGSNLMVKTGDFRVGI